MYKKLLILSICFCSFSSNAEESIPEYLISTPATLMDFGLYNIVEKFKYLTLVHSKEYSVNPYWNKEEGFVLRIISNYENKTNKESAIQNCNLAIDEVKNWLGIDTKTGEPKDGVASYFGASFESYGSNSRESGFHESGYPNSIVEFRKKIDKIVTIEGFMGTNDKSEVVNCKSKLVE